MLVPLRNQNFPYAFNQRNAETIKKKEFHTKNMHKDWKEDCPEIYTEIAKIYWP